MILDDEALVERVAEAIAKVQVETYGNSTYAIFWKHEALAAIEVVRVHMWDDMK